MKRILCYGDSNTWGFTPGCGVRFDENTRWTKIVQKILGDEYEIIEDGINGRTTVWDHPYLGSYVNGYKGLPFSLFREKPIDLVVMMLGTNDIIYTDAEGTYRGLYKVAKALKNADSVFEGDSDGSKNIFVHNPDVLLVAPVVSSESTISDPDGGFRYRESRKIIEKTKQVAEALSLPFFDASSVAAASNVDGIHMDEENHLKLGKALAEEIRKHFSKEAI